MKKEANLELIFDRLDSDGDNCISVDAIDTNAVSPDIVRVI